MPIAMKGRSLPSISHGTSSKLTDYLASWPLSNDCSCLTSVEYVNKINTSNDFKMKYFDLFGQ